MTVSQRLNKTVSVTLNASGVGTAIVGPAQRFEVWKVERLVTEGSSAVEPELNIYRGASSAVVPSDFTPFGNSDISETTTEFELMDGETITIAYSGGSANAVMRLRIEGWINYRQ